MNQVLKEPMWISFHFHHEILDKKHRENCGSCTSAYSGMNLYVELIRESEIKVESA